MISHVLCKARAWRHSVRQQSHLRHASSTLNRWLLVALAIMPLIVWMVAASAVQLVTWKRQRVVD